jgi:hypothetical protein
MLNRVVCFSFLHLLVSQAVGQVIVNQAETALPAPSLQQLLTQLNQTPSGQEVASTSSPVVTSTGLWGTLEYYPVFLEAPESLIERFPIPSSKPRWVFESVSESDIRTLLQGCGLSNSLLDSIFAAQPPVTEGKLTYLFPPVALLEAIEPEVRAKIYAELRKVSANEYHVDPVLITSGDVESWFKGADIDSNSLAFIKKHAYTRGDCLAFSDLPALMAVSAGESHMKKLMKVLTRSRCLMVSVKLDTKTDVDKVMNYWTTGLNTRKKDVASLIKSIIAVRGESSMDLNHLLPATPRKLLYTYPDMSMFTEGIMPDCHWSSLNFFNYDVKPYLLDARLATTVVLEQFSPVQPPYKFGDIMFLLDSKHGDAFHSCVYIADDIVYTKNGRNIVSPWLLMKLEDVQKIYIHDGNGRVQAYRNKSAPQLLSETGKDSS